MPVLSIVENWKYHIGNLAQEVRCWKEKTYSEDAHGKWEADLCSTAVRHLV